MTRANLKGHCVEKRAMEIAATGGHSILLFGPHGAGKSTIISAYPEVINAHERDSCTCGNYGNPRIECRCNKRLLYRWLRRVSRVAETSDMILEVCHVPSKELQVKPDSRADEYFNARVSAAIVFGATNHSLELRDDSAARTVEMVMRRLGFTVGRYNRMLAVARTIANLDASPLLKAKHVAESCQYMYLRSLTT